MIHSFLPESSTSKKKKRRANAFLLFRNAKMKDRPHKITMTDYSRILADEWKRLDEKERTYWKMQYEISRDYLPDEDHEDIATPLPDEDLVGPLPHEDPVEPSSADIIIPNNPISYNYLCNNCGYISQDGFCITCYYACHQPYFNFNKNVEDNSLPNVLNDCYLTESPSENFDILDKL